MQDRGASSTERISDGLYKDILAGILMGEYPPQTTLPTELRLAKDYGVSRSVVRSALDLLKRDGVVRSRQGSGTVVSATNPRKMAQLNREAQLPVLKDCFACRRAIEPEIAALVARAPSNPAMEFLETQHRLLSSDDADTEYQRSVQDAQFHIRLAEFSGNSFFASIMTMLHPHMLFAMNIAKTLSSRAQLIHADRSRKEHLKIIEKVLDRDSAAARKAMLNHLESGYHRIFPEDRVEE